MRKVAIVTDSTAYIPQELVDSLGITVVPLNVLWDGKSYQDGVEMHPADFYNRLKVSTTMPSTSQPSPHDFLTPYKTLLDQGLDVVSIHISAKLSGTYASALQARDMLESDRIVVIDSELTSMALGFPAILAARAARDGQALRSCAKVAKDACARSGAVFVVKTLDFLHRGGRIGSVAALLGTALDLKPILMLKDGKIEAVEKVRTRSKSLARLVNLFLELAAGKKGVYLSIIEADAGADAHNTLEQVKLQLSEDFVLESVLTPVSPVIGTHTGPGTIGIAYTFVE